MDAEIIEQRLADFPADYVVGSFSDKTDLPPLLSIGTKAPCFTLKDIKGSSVVSLDNVKGRWTVLFFWDLHCGYCMAALPKVDSLANQYSSDKVSFVMITDGNRIKTDELLQKKKIGLINLSDDKRQVYKSYQVSSVPVYYLLDKDKKIIASATGFKGYQKIMQEVKF